MFGESCAYENGLLGSVDWISFTAFRCTDVNEVMELLGYSSADFQLMPKGASGYKTMHKLISYPLRILSDGNENMGIHVEISGSAVHDALEHFKESLSVPSPFGMAYLKNDFDNTYMLEFLKTIRCIGTLTRLDLAVDDFGCSFYSVEGVVNELEKGKVVSKFRSYKDILESQLNGEITGHTLYLGSRSSDIMLRIYDKRLEQRNKNPDALLLDKLWVRWELELKDERANAALDALLLRKSLGDVIVEVLNNYVRIIKLDNLNRSRCSTEPLWLQFVHTINKLKLYVPDSNKTLEDKRNWIVQNVLPTLSGVVLADGGCLDVITQNFENAVIRMSKEMQHIVLKHNPDALSDFEGRMLK